MSILIGKGQQQVHLLPQMATRHGLITGATGTGKTVTIQVMAEHFSAIGVPVFVADIKGDFSGIAVPGSEHPKITERIETIGMEDFDFQGYPTAFWDVFKEHGHPVRTSISELGPLLLSRLLRLSDVQFGVLTIAFQIADDQGLLLLDLKDLRALLNHIDEEKAEISKEYGRVTSASIGAIQRALLTLEQDGGEEFFGEPVLRLEHLMRTDLNGRGVINVLDAQKLIHAPKTYTTFLLWLLSELFEQLPEVGEVEKPKFVFFFEEAHLLFNEAPEILLEKILQLVRLIRSKGVGVYFVTQNPLDIPDDVLGQLGNRVQHALRAYTPREQAAVKAAAETFRANPAFNTEEAITQLGVGEALLSFLDEDGVPGMVERALICPPHSRIGPMEDLQKDQMIKSSLLSGIYEQEVDRESAYELLKKRAEETKEKEETADDGNKKTSDGSLLTDVLGVVAGVSTSGSSKRQSPLEAAIKSAARSVGSHIGRSIIRGLMGSLTKR